MVSHFTLLSILGRITPPAFSVLYWTVLIESWWWKARGRAGSSWEVEGTPRERTHRTHGRWPVSRTDISTSNDSERLMMVNRLLKNLLHPSTSVPCDYALSLKFPPIFHILLKCCCFFKLYTRQSLIAVNQVRSAQTVIWPLSPWWRLSLNVIM